VPTLAHCIVRSGRALAVFALGCALACGGGVRGDLEIDSRRAPGASGALRDLASLYGKAHPAAAVNLSAGAPLTSRLRGGTPPDVFLAPAGMAFLHDPLFAGRLTDLSALAREEGWIDGFPAAVKKSVADEGGLWMAPVGVHRSARLWYAPAELTRRGVTVPRTWDDFQAMVSKLRSLGVAPLALGPAEGALDFFEAVAVAELGPDDWEALWEGRLPPDGPAMERVWRRAGSVLAAAFGGRAAVPSADPARELETGRAAFAFLDGGATDGAGPEESPDLECAGAPGTDGIFVFSVDGFALPRAAKNKAAAREWLKLCSSREAEGAFNRARDAISVRLDADLSGCDGKTRSASLAYRKDRLVGSLAHGMTADADFITDLKPVLEAFLADRNAPRASRDFAALMKKHGVLK